MNAIAVGALAGSLAVVSAAGAVVYPRFVGRRRAGGASTEGDVAAPAAARRRDFATLAVTISNGTTASIVSRNGHAAAPVELAPMPSTSTDAPTPGAERESAPTGLKERVQGMLSGLRRSGARDGAAEADAAAAVPPTVAGRHDEVEADAFAVRYAEPESPRAPWWSAITRISPWRRSGGEAPANLAEVDVEDGVVGEVEVLPRKPLLAAEAAVDGERAPTIPEVVQPITMGTDQSAGAAETPDRLETGAAPIDGRLTASAADPDVDVVPFADARITAYRAAQPATVKSEPPATHEHDTAIAQGGSEHVDHHLMVSRDEPTLVRDEESVEVDDDAAQRLGYSLSLITLQLNDANRWARKTDDVEPVVLSDAELAAADARLAEFAATPIFEAKVTLSAGIVPAWAAEYAEAGVDVSDEGRARLVEGYGLLTDDALAVDLRRVFLTDESPVVRSAALMLLSERPLRELAPDAAECARHPDPSERCAAVAALTALRDRETLVSLLADEDQAVLKAAVVGLVGVIGPEEARRLIESAPCPHRDEALALVAFV